MQEKKISFGRRLTGPSHRNVANRVAAHQQSRQESALFRMMTRVTDLGSEISSTVKHGKGPSSTIGLTK